MTTSADDVYLLCTNIASAAWNERAPLHHEARQRLSSLDPGRIFISSVTVGEIEYGLQSAHLRTRKPVNPEKQRQVRERMAAYKVFGTDHHTGRIYGEIKTVLMDRFAPRNSDGSFRNRKVDLDDLVEPITGKELGIQENDLWIVSLAKQFNLVFVTNDQLDSMKRIIGAAEYAARTQYLGVK